jgi:hypothetical protein
MDSIVGVTGGIPIFSYLFGITFCVAYMAITPSFRTIDFYFTYACLVFTYKLVKLSVLGIKSPHNGPEPLYFFELASYS